MGGNMSGGGEPEQVARFDTETTPENQAATLDGAANGAIESGASALQPPSWASRASSCEKSNS